MSTEPLPNKGRKGQMPDREARQNFPATVRMIVPFRPFHLVLSLRAENRSVRGLGGRMSFGCDAGEGYDGVEEREAVLQLCRINQEYQLQVDPDQEAVEPYSCDARLVWMRTGDSGCQMGFQMKSIHQINDLFGG